MNRLKYAFYSAKYWILERFIFDKYNYKLSRMLDACICKKEKYK